MNLLRQAQLNSNSRGESDHMGENAANMGA